MRDARQCLLKWHIGWVLNWQQIDQRGARERGNIWHEMLALHYRLIQAGHSRAEVEDGVYELLDTFYSDHEEYETLTWMYEGYLEKHGLDEDWEILEIEQTQTVPFLHADGSPTRFVYEWTSDILVRERSTGHMIVVDNKSTGSKMRKIDIDLDDQFGLYTFAQRRSGRMVLYQLYNGAITKKLKRPMTLAERFQRTPSYRTATELVAIEADALETCTAMYPEDGPARIYSAPNPRVCSWSCDFLEAHLAMRKSKNPDRMLPALMRARGFTQEGDHRGNPARP